MKRKKKQVSGPHVQQYNILFIYLVHASGLFDRKQGRSVFTSQ